MHWKSKYNNISCFICVFTIDCKTKFLTIFTYRMIDLEMPVFCDLKLFEFVFTACARALALGIRLNRIHADKQIKKLNSFTISTALGMKKR